jgi:hypothetical protein
MEDLAAEIVELIKDYRSEGGIRIDVEHVLTWVDQFDKGDRKFLLSELLHILPKSYISKKEAIETIEDSFEYLYKKYGHSSAVDFLAHSIFLDCQEPHKSQTLLLDFLKKHSKKKLGFDFKNCGSEGAKYWIYFDDVLASGGTFRKDIIEEIENYGVEQFKSEGIKIVGVFFFLHDWGASNVRYMLQTRFGQDINNRIDFHRVHQIENDPRINYYNPDPQLNHVFPIKDDRFPEWDEYLESLKADRNSQYAYRNAKYPKKEEFYSSAENRNRYERIILNKGLEILEKVDVKSPPIRPLGLISPSYKTFGTGSHAFTWRNISNTCPLVYWWENHEWTPLFSVENRGNH